MYRLFWYSRLSQNSSVRMTKDSPSAASLALRSRCSAFRRCISRVSDIEYETRPSQDYKMRESSSRSPDTFGNLESLNGTIHPKLEPDNASVYVRPRNCPLDGGLLSKRCVDINIGITAPVTTPK